MVLLIRKNLNVYVHEANVDCEQAQQKSPFCTFGVLSQEYQSRQIPDSANHQERREGNFCDPCPVSKVAGILKNLWTTTCVLIHECSHRFSFSFMVPLRLGGTDNNLSRFAELIYIVTNSRTLNNFGEIRRQKFLTALNRRNV